MPTTVGQQRHRQPPAGGRRRPPHLLAWLWLLAGLVALALLLATGALYVQANAGADTFAGVVAGPEGAVYLRSRPHPAAGVITILEPGDLLDVRDSREIDGARWYRVHTERNRGWLPQTRVERTN